MTSISGNPESIVPRELSGAIARRLETDSRVILLFGARRVGKTTLVKHLLEKKGWKSLEMTGDDISAVEALSSRDGARLKGMAEGFDALFVDEAQRIPEIGLSLKLLHDGLPGLKIIATGSSALDLASKTKESLAGRAWSFTLYPFCRGEIIASEGRFEAERQLERDLVFGTYPEVRLFPGDKDRSDYLRELHASYLFKDILELGGLRHPRKMVDLLKLLAFQVGSEVSFSELGNTLNVSKDTVSSYIDLLEKSFIVFRLSAFSRNLRSEVSRSCKIFFQDNGVRNAAIGDFRPFADRQDRGALWENFIIAERRKRLSLMESEAHSYFWRLATGAEIDYVEESSGKLTGWELKVSPEARARLPKSWTEAYPDASWARIDRSNYLDLL